MTQRLTYIFANTHLRGNGGIAAAAVPDDTDQLHHHAPDE
jgi:hypothetical protein